MPPSDALVVFARVPVAGQVKTRLAASVGEAAALAAYRELAERTLATAGAARAAGGVRVVVAFTPDDGEAAMRAWLGDAAEYEPQGEGDLGRRLHAAAARRFADGATRVVMVGTDCPAMTPADVAQALAALESADVVLGPADDGGYWLVGLSAPHAAPFDDVPWSSSDTLTVTLRRAQEAGLRVALLGRRADVDTVADWRAWKAAEAGAEAAGG